MEYTSFIFLLGALYVISGGILIEGAFRGTPQSNTLLLGIGAVLANLIGTTGASLLLVRPLIRGNLHRRHVVHVPVFFIFIVANCGGLLTPLGDPPLFLGFLQGVPFEWTLRLFPQWALMNGALLVIFAVWDWIASRRDARDGAIAHGNASDSPFSLRGAHNFAFLARCHRTLVRRPTRLRQSWQSVAIWIPGGRTARADGGVVLFDEA